MAIIGPTSCEPRPRSLERRLAHLQVALYVLHHDDGSSTTSPTESTIAISR